MADIIKSPEQQIEKKPQAKVKLLSYKLAFPTEDGHFISEHFGRSSAFLIAEVQGKKVINKDLRPNDSHVGLPENNEQNNELDDQQKSSAHNRIIDILYDVDIIIAKRLGPKAYNDLTSNGFTVIKTEISLIDDALKAFLAGKLK